jgi:hypothetical protein
LENKPEAAKLHSLWIRAFIIAFCLLVTYGMKGMSNFQITRVKADTSKL